MKANRAANSIGSCRHEGVDGVIARAGIAFWWSTVNLRKTYVSFSQTNFGH